MNVKVNSNNGYSSLILYSISGIFPNWLTFCYIWVEMMRLWLFIPFGLVVFCLRIFITTKTLHINSL